MRWAYQGVPLAPPLTILRRLLFWAPAQLFRTLFCVFIAAGWGISAAGDAWRKTN